MERILRDDKFLIIVKREPVILQLKELKFILKGAPHSKRGEVFRLETKGRLKEWKQREKAP